MTHQKLTTLQMERLTLQEFKDAPKIPLVVVLDNVRSMYNVGSIFRTSDAFRLQAIYLCGLTATPPHPEIHKTALGAEDSVTWHHYPHTQDAIQQLRSQGYTILAIEQCQGSTMLQDFHPTPGTPYAIIMGNEVKGVQQDIVDQAHHCLEIPQYGTKHSMNVSVTTGIVIWHFAQALIHNK